MNAVINTFWLIWAVHEDQTAVPKLEHNEVPPRIAKSDHPQVEGKLSRSSNKHSCQGGPTQTSTHTVKTRISSSVSRNLSCSGCDPLVSSDLPNNDLLGGPIPITTTERFPASFGGR